MELAEKIRTDARLIAKSLLEIAVERGDMREALRVHRKKFSEFLGFENADYFVICLQYLAGKTHMRFDFRDNDFIDVVVSAEMIDFLADA